MPGITIADWGPGAWNTLHAFAHSAPVDLTPADAAAWREFLGHFQRFLPCPRCRAHFADFLRRRLPRDGPPLRTRAELVALLNDAHNEVNARLGRRVYTLDEHYRVYRTPTPVVIPVAALWVGALATALVGGLVCVRQRTARARP